VTANVVAPGFIEGTEFFGGTMADEHRDRLIAETKVQRADRPEDVAAAVRYLASPEAGFVTGHVLHVKWAKPSSAGNAARSSRGRTRVADLVLG
jgi:3-oxoacyl-[acyl-carrier protein] reductase